MLNSLFRRWNEFPPSRDKAGLCQLASMISYFSPSTYPLRSRLSLDYQVFPASKLPAHVVPSLGGPLPHPQGEFPGPRPEPISSVTSSCHTPTPPVIPTDNHSLLHALTALGPSSQLGNSLVYLLQAAPQQGKISHPPICVPLVSGNWKAFLLIRFNCVK